MVLELKKALIPPHPLINFEIKEYYENEPRFGNLSPVEYSTENIQHIQNKVNVHHFQ